MNTLNCLMKVNSIPLGIFIMEMKLHCFHRNLSNNYNFGRGIRGIHHVCVEKFVRVDCGDDCDDKFYLIWTRK